MIEVVIPESIKVGGFDWNIEKGLETNRDLSARFRQGECDYHNKRLRISTAYDPQHISSIFIHEFLHAIDIVYDNQGLNDDAIAVLANGLHQVLEQLGIRFVLKEA